MALGASRLVGRDEELALLETAVGGDRRSVVVAGAVGVGKSRLVEELLDRLGDSTSRDGDGPVRVVRLRATASTATIPFGPFAAWAPDRVGDTAAGDRLEILQSISRQLVSGSTRTVVAMDDAHLLDEGSAALVLHLVGLPDVSVVITVRSGESCPDAVAALWKEGLAERVDLQTLSEHESIEMAESLLLGPVGAEAQRRLYALTGGTPLYLREVVRSGLDQAVLHEVEGVWRWRGELTGGGQLADLVDRHLARATEDQQRALELLAFGEPLPVELVEELGVLEAMTDVEYLGYAVTEPGPDGLSVRLAHPLYGEVLRTRVPRLSGLGYLRRLAAAADAVGWQERDPLRVARWWLDAGTTQGSPEAFMKAAVRAHGLAEWQLAVRFARAAEASGHGPQATLARAISLVPLARLDEAQQLFDDLQGQHLDGVMTAELAIAYSRFLFWSRGDTTSAVAVTVEAAERLEPPLRGRVLAYGAYLAVFASDPAEGARMATEAAAGAGAAVGYRVEAMAVAALAWMLQGRASAATTAAEMALPYAPAQLEIDPNPTAVLPAAYAMARIVEGRFDLAAEIAAATLTLSYADEVRIFRGLANTLAGRVALAQGRLDRARQWAEEGVSILRAAGLPAHWPTAVFSTVAAQLGDPAAAREMLAWSDRAGPAAPLYVLELEMARAWVADAEGQLSTAREIAGDVAHRAAVSGARAYELFALLDLARLGAPEEVVDRLAELADLVDGAFAPAALVYARALAEGDGEALDSASARFETMGAPLLAAEAAAHAVVVHRRTGRRGSAIASVARARKLAAGCGSPCTPALRTIDAGPALGALTGREREVVELAARGHTNREIADRLFVSVRTVNTHLAHAYEKLGLNDRTQLADLLSAPSP